MPEPKTNQFKTSELHLITFLRLNNLRPVRRDIAEDSRASLYYERTGSLEEALVAYMCKCEMCGIAWSEVGGAFSEAKRMLLDGDLGSAGKSEDKKRGGNR